MTTVSIIIPAFNEGRFISPLLEHILRVPIESIGFKKEIIVVDDGSTDNTAEQVKRFPEVRSIYQQNTGKGAAVQHGIHVSNGEYILVQDADLEYNPDDYLQMLKPLCDAPDSAVYGSRIKGVIRDHGWHWPFPGKQTNQSLGPWLMNVLLTLITYLLFGRWVTDMLTGYKIYPRSFLASFKAKTCGFETDHELSAKLFKDKHQIIEVPIAYKPRSIKEGKKIGPLDGVKAIATLIRFRFLD